MFNPFSQPATFNGLRIFECPEMVVYVGEDWSRVRSPGRARRRRKKHPQNIVALYEPDGRYLIDERRGAIYCHPAMARKLYIAARESLPLFTCALLPDESP